LKNKFEEAVYKSLCKEYGRNNVSYEAVKIPYTTEHLYVPDFRITDGGSLFFVESKGYLRPDNRRTMCAVRDQHPELDLRIVFQKNQKIDKRSKTTYAQWAEKQGFQYCVGLHTIKDIFE
jgi:predicted nuclease of restriction endonuclease-like RecB superfamily